MKYLALILFFAVSCTTHSVEFQNTKEAYGYISDVKISNPTSFHDVVNDTTIYIYNYKYDVMTMRKERVIIYRPENGKNIFIAEN